MLKSNYSILQVEKYLLEVLPDPKAKRTVFYPKVQQERMYLRWGCGGIDTLCISNHWPLLELVCSQVVQHGHLFWLYSKGPDKEPPMVYERLGTKRKQHRLAWAHIQFTIRQKRAIFTNYHFNFSSFQYQVWRM